MIIKIKIKIKILMKMKNNNNNNKMIIVHLKVLKTLMMTLAKIIRTLAKLKVKITKIKTKPKILTITNKIKKTWTKHQPVQKTNININNFTIIIPAKINKTIHLIWQILNQYKKILINSNLRLKTKSIKIYHQSERKHKLKVIKIKKMKIDYKEIIKKKLKRIGIKRIIIKNIKIPIDLLFYKIVYYSNYIL